MKRKNSSKTFALWNFAKDFVVWQQRGKLELLTSLADRILFYAPIDFPFSQQKSVILWQFLKWLENDDCWERRRNFSNSFKICTHKLNSIFCERDLGNAMRSPDYIVRILWLLCMLNLCVQQWPSNRRMPVQIASRRNYEFASLFAIHTDTLFWFSRVSHRRDLISCIAKWFNKLKWIVVSVGKLSAFHCFLPIYVEKKSMQIREKICSVV